MFRYLFVLCVAASLAACASPAKVSAMVGMPTVQLAANSPLKQSVQVTSVLGGKDTNPLWTSQVGNGEFQQALQETLSQQGMLSAMGARYRLEVALVELKQPFIGLTYTVTSSVHYTLKESASGRVAFDQTVTVDGMATVSDAFAGVERLRLANENSIKNNLSKFLDQLIGMLGRGMASIGAVDVRING